MIAFSASVSMPPAPRQFDRQRWCILLNRAESLSLETVLGREELPNGYDGVQAINTGRTMGVVRLIERYAQSIDQEINAFEFYKWLPTLNEETPTRTFLADLIPAWIRAGLVVRYTRSLSSDAGRITCERQLSGQTIVRMRLDEARTLLEAIEVDPGLLVPGEDSEMLVGSLSVGEMLKATGQYLLGAELSISADLPRNAKSSDFERAIKQYGFKPTESDQSSRAVPRQRAALRQRVQALRDLAQWARGCDPEAMIVWG